MIKHDYIPLNSPAQWNAALDGIKHAFAHTWEACYAIHLTTEWKTYLYCFEADEIRIVCPIVEREFRKYTDVVTPYGFSGFVGNKEYPQFSMHWNEFVRQRGYICGYIGLNPYLGSKTYFEPNDLYPSNSTYVLDLTLSSEELFANLSTNRKRQLKNWSNHLPQLVFEKSILRDFLLTHYLDFVRSKGASSVYDFSKDTLSFLLDLDNVLIVGARGTDQVEAVSVFAHSEHAGEYLFNVSLPVGRHHAVTLLWYGVNYLRECGIPLLNLGGGISKDDGVAHFKQRFGATEMSLASLNKCMNSKRLRCYVNR
jgi:hypothetical protein